MRLLILYTELAGYTLATLKYLVKQDKNTTVLLVHYPVNKEAPFQLNFSESLVNIEYSKQKEAMIADEITKFQPQAIISSGWSNSFYLKISKQYFHKAVTIVNFDNQWRGTIKQYILRIIAPFWLNRIFKVAWVPGDPQKEYALRLGFKKHRIFKGFYVADEELFSKIGEQKLAQTGAFPKTFISVARYIPQKDLPTLWKAFIAANANCKNKWTLFCLGFGELYEQRIQDEHIQHLGFKQPHEMAAILQQSGVYVLPSLYEPWAVAVHEMAFSAMPMVLSDKVGSVSMFLSNNNGYTFQSGNVEELQQKLETIMNKTDDELREMAKNSFEAGHSLGLNHWPETLKLIMQSCAE
ncbi:MAG: glycosyltransferase family 4 protein [Bacteroidota bacterium]